MVNIVAVLVARPGYLDLVQFVTLTACGERCVVLATYCEMKLVVRLLQRRVPLARAVNGKIRLVRRQQKSGIAAGI